MMQLTSNTIGLNDGSTAWRISAILYLLWGVTLWLMMKERKLAVRFEKKLKQLKGG